MWLGLGRWYGRWSLVSRIGSKRRRARSRFRRLRGREAVSARGRAATSTLMRALESSTGQRSSVVGIGRSGFRFGVRLVNRSASLETSLAALTRTLHSMGYQRHRRVVKFNLARLARDAESWAWGVRLRVKGKVGVGGNNRKRKYEAAFGPGSRTSVMDRARVVTGVVGTWSGCLGVSLEAFV